MRIEPRWSVGFGDRSVFTRRPEQVWDRQNEPPAGERVICPLSSKRLVSCRAGRYSAGNTRMIADLVIPADVTDTVTCLKEVTGLVLMMKFFVR